ncbi:hypothetical protein DFP72DRAFT_878806 [Ephemerocybe angulata]|uniref:Uncharacterized protein n=1 Tax=Ephemerocybe angulata TaxID=980116 RepID=A0A8H6IBS1_9AGAR|nr:hypothetical protein DFP72DRAFT_878806 [Tulosesus angulatus]
MWAPLAGIWEMGRHGRGRRSSKVWDRKRVLLNTSPFVAFVSPPQFPFRVRDRLTRCLSLASHDAEARPPPPFRPLPMTATIAGICKANYPTSNSRSRPTTPRTPQTFSPTIRIQQTPHDARSARATYASLSTSTTTRHIALTQHQCATTSNDAQLYDHHVADDHHTSRLHSTTPE